jgi:hypothetical protein
MTRAPAGLRSLLALGAIGLALGPAAPTHAQAQAPADVTAEIARLRARLADNGAQEQHCMAGATQPVWTASLATDLKALQERARQAAAEGAAADTQRWTELARKAEALEAQAAVNARTGAELFQSQQIGLECLDRFAGEREALHASLEVAVTDPAGYGESLRQAREHGTARLRQDLARLREQSRALSAQWKQTPTEAGAGATALRADLDRLRRRHTVVLESEAARALAEPSLRGTEALVAAAAAWERERAAAGRVAAARDEAERRLAGRERDEAGRLAREYWTTAERLLAR